MSNRFAVFADASFLRTEGAKRLGIQPSRSELDPDGVARYFALSDSGERLLRIYWYDGEFPNTHPASIEQRKYLDAVGLTPSITLRLGIIKSVMPQWLRGLRHRLESEGVAASLDIRPLDVQKGVDTLLALDLVRLAQKHAYETAVLVAGDRDLVEAVRTAQDEGCVVILAFPDGAGVDPELLRSADEVRVIDHNKLRGLIRTRETAPATPGVQPPPGIEDEDVEIQCPTEDCGTTVRVRLALAAGSSALPTCPNCGKRFHVHRRGDDSLITRQWGYTKTDPAPTADA